MEGVTDRRRILTGWGSTPSTAATVIDVGDAASAAAALADVGARRSTLIARGMGRSYGDAAQRAGAAVAAMRSCRGPLVVEEDPGHPGAATLRAGAGWTVGEVQRRLIERGWFLPVVPGTAHVTLGGAVAADIHGKNHHRAGSFGAHVGALEVVSADGERVQLHPGDDRFDATVGGMGLTAIIVEVSVALTPVSSDQMALRSRRTRDLDDTLDALESADATAGVDEPYSVAWVDLSSPERAGRGVVQVAGHLGDPAVDEAGDGPRRRRRTRGSTDRGQQGTLAVPPVRVNLMRAPVIAALNELWWRRAPAAERHAVTSASSFFHPLDAAVRWPRVYGPAGFTQWQMVVPFDAVEVLRSCAAALAAHRRPPALTVLKRLGAPAPAPLSFPAPGWTLAVDVPADDPTTAALLDDLDEAVAGCGGRIYLAKDGRARPEVVAAMYPRLVEWRATRDRLDPGGRFASDLSVRLGLTR